MWLASHILNGNQKFQLQSLPINVITNITNENADNEHFWVLPNTSICGCYRLTYPTDFRCLLLILQNIKRVPWKLYYSIEFAFLFSIKVFSALFSMKIHYDSKYCLVLSIIFNIFIIFSSEMITSGHFQFNTVNVKLAFSSEFFNQKWKK